MPSLAESAAVSHLHTESYAFMVASRSRKRTATAVAQEQTISITSRVAGSATSTSTPASLASSVCSVVGNSLSTWGNGSWGPNSARFSARSLSSSSHSANMQATCLSGSSMSGSGVSSKGASSASSIGRSVALYRGRGSWIAGASSYSSSGASSSSPSGTSSSVGTNGPADRRMREGCVLCNSGRSAGRLLGTQPRRFSSAMACTFLVILVPPLIPSSQSFIGGLLGASIGSSRLSGMAVGQWKVKHVLTGSGAPARASSPLRRGTPPIWLSGYSSCSARQPIHSMRTSIVSVFWSIASTALPSMTRPSRQPPTACQRCSSVSAGTRASMRCPRSSGSASVREVHGTYWKCQCASGSPLWRSSATSIR